MCQSTCMTFVICTPCSGQLQCGLRHCNLCGCDESMKSICHKLKTICYLFSHCFYICNTLWRECKSLEDSTEVAQVYTCESHAGSFIAIQIWDFMSDLGLLINLGLSDSDFYF